jgi:hypothetical protein
LRPRFPEFAALVGSSYPGGIEWYCSEPRTINLRLAAVRRLAYEAADAGLLSRDLAAGVRRVKGAKKFGVRAGNWLTAE